MARCDACSLYSPGGSRQKMLSHLIDKNLSESAMARWAQLLPCRLHCAKSLRRMAAASFAPLSEPQKDASWLRCSVLGCHGLGSACALKALAHRMCDRSVKRDAVRQD
eukprot:7376958-Prymnesium_polylepis.3